MSQLQHHQRHLFSRFGSCHAAPDFSVNGLQPLADEGQVGGRHAHHVIRRPVLCMRRSRALQQGAEPVLPQVPERVGAHASIDAQCAHHLVAAARAADDTRRQQLAQHQLDMFNVDTQPGSYLR
jgi:hypothetical protein